VEIRRERKVVTVLFVDLVGFTSRSESMDPEDVEVELSRYHARVRDELERHGGTVEKFIGDAVMAVFGAPTTHEDDAERAVRAALAVRQWATGDGGIDVRIGVNTGEALVRVGARAEYGESTAVGDVVNTAARLQTAAPTNGVIVGEVTRRATRKVIDYELADAVHAKGKVDPVRAWVVADARARVGDEVIVTTRTPFLGREHELQLLRAWLARARSEREPQLVTLVGVPGIGKSRLLHELARLVDTDPELVTWRQGHCLPYGDGVSLWALAGIVKAEAGILENDPPEVAEEKLAKTIDARGDDVDVDWMLTRLRPLVGIADADASHAERTEQFAAWRQFIEGLAETGPAVVVFEDLHWADDTLLDFLDELIELASGVPLFVVATARPELLAKRPAWGGGRTNALTLSLQPLAPEATATLVDELLGASGRDEDVRAAILERAEGNPLYAEEFARMVEEQPGSTLQLPDSVHGIIAARLDMLPVDQKRLLQFAAVVGKRFWVGAVATLATTPAAAIEEQLHALERRELVRRERRSSLAGDTQFSFRHIVARDVAYGQIPRADRSALHLRVAKWMSALGRPDDHAELIAHHYLAAIEYGRAAGTDVAELVEPARRALRTAGERAVALGNHAAAAEFFTGALALDPDENERADMLAAAGTSRWYATGAIPHELRDAAAMLDELGRPEAAASAHVSLARAESLRGSAEEAEHHLAEADRLLATYPASPVRFRAVLARAGMLMVGGHFERALALATPELPAIERLGQPDLLARAFDVIGCSRTSLGDESGLDLQYRAIEIARAGRAVYELQVALNNLSSVLTGQGRLRDLRDVLRMRQETFDSFGGSAETRNWFLCSLASQDYCDGDWDSALDNLTTMIARVPAGSTVLIEATARPLLQRILVARRLDQDPRPDLQHALLIARSTFVGKILKETYINAADVLITIGAVDEARVMWEMGLSLFAELPGDALDDELISFALTGVKMRAEEAALSLLPPGRSAWVQAAGATLRHDFASAADQLQEIGHRPAAAFNDFWAGGPRRESAREFFESVGAVRYLAR
jgi:class 3 adenylate cyclase/tetratricopeptide (TPR) repeat protein